MAMPTLFRIGSVPRMSAIANPSTTPRPSQRFSGVSSSIPTTIKPVIPAVLRYIKAQVFVS